MYENPTWSSDIESSAAFGPGSLAKPPLPCVSIAALTETRSPATATLPSTMANAGWSPPLLSNRVSVAPSYDCFVVVAPFLAIAASNQAWAATGSVTDSSVRPRNEPIAAASSPLSDEAGGSGPIASASSPPNHGLISVV